jgi:hypothetical protein
VFYLELVLKAQGFHYPKKDLKNAAKQYPRNFLRGAYFFGSFICPWHDAVPCQAMAFSPESTLWKIRVLIVIGPTPPGTGV